MDESGKLLTKGNEMVVVVAQLAEHVLQTPHVPCSNPVIGKCLLLTFEKTKVKKKSPGMAHILRKRLSFECDKK